MELEKSNKMSTNLKIYRTVIELYINIHEFILKNTIKFANEQQEDIDNFAGDSVATHVKMKSNSRSYSSKTLNLKLEA